jgi:hypothetical protein
MQGSKRRFVKGCRYTLFGTLFHVEICMFENVQNFFSESHKNIGRCSCLKQRLFEQNC